MNCELCDLVKGKDGFVVTICNTCRETMPVSKEHKPEFSDAEKEMIRSLFKGREIRWEMRKEKSHVHCHIHNHPFVLQKEK